MVLKTVCNCFSIPGTDTMEITKNKTVLRIFDSFLNEGGKILYRVALGFLKKMKAELLKTITEKRFIKVLSQHAHNWSDADALMKVCPLATILTNRNLLLFI